MTPARSLALKAAAVAAVYALLDLLSAVPSLRISFMMEAIWLPSGFLFAVLLRFPRRQWPAFLGAATLAGFLVNLGQRWTPGPALAFALTDPLEVLAGAWIATALLKGRKMDLTRIPDALVLGLAGAVNGIVAGGLGILATQAARVPLPSAYTGAVWSCSVLLSHLFLPPLVLAWPADRSRRARRIAESLLWMAAGTAVTRWSLHMGAPHGAAGLMMFLPFPLLVAAGLRTGPWGVSLSLLAVSFTALVEGTHGHGPLPVQALAPDLMLVWIQLFLATEAISILVLACAAEDQRRTEGSLLESESRYRHLVEQFPDAILLREGSRIRYANPAALALFGATSARDLEGRSIREFLDRSEPSSGELTNSGIHRYTPALRERLLNALDGRQLPVEVTDISISLAGQRPVTLDVFRDLSKRRAAEDALRRSELEFQRFFEMAPVPLLLVDLEDGALLQANAPSHALFEIPEGRLEGLHTSDFYVRQEDRARLRERVLGTGRADGVEIDILTQKGRLRRVLVSAALVSHGGKDAILAGFMDVTLRMKTELALRQAQKLESLGLMAGGVAHDFNNLLTALIGNLELARMSLPDPGEAEPFFEAMASTLRRAGDLARQMLAYAGQAQVEIRPVDLNAAIRELTALMSASMSKKIELRLELAADLPLIEGDPVQLQQVLLNLVTNAAEAIGDQEGAIVLRSRQDAAPASEDGGPGSVVVEVSDTGAGMSPEVQARIFDPFFTTKATGRGLGLSTLQGILKAHRGRATVQSQPGQGTTFSLRFPLPDRPIQPQAGTSTGPFALDRAEGRILLVDDEADIRMTAGSLLRRMGFEVLEAADGREALSEVERHGGQLRLVILDLSMPRMDGAEALARLRSTHPDLPVILSSGFDPNRRTPDLLKEPKTWFLPKPYRLSDLRKLVGEVLGA